MKFGRDPRRWVEWLFEAGKRYSLSILNFVKDVKDGLIGRVRVDRLQKVKGALNSGATGCISL